MFNQLRADLTAQSWFNDSRLSERLGKIVEQIGNNFGKSLPQCGGNHGQTQAIYRFMSNDKVNPQRLCASESNRVVEQLRTSVGQTYLAISDTTGLNYSYSKTRDSLNCLGKSKQKGYYCHSLSLFDALGCPQGLLNQQFYNRAPDQVGTARKMKSTFRKQSPIEEKESHRWLADYQTLEEHFSDMPQHRVVHIMDAEADMFELFALRRYAHIHFLCRVRFDRTLENTKNKLKTHVSESPCQGCMKIRIKDDKTNQKRTAHLEIRFSKVSLQVPRALKDYQKDKDYQPIEVNVVHIKEITPKGTNTTDFTPLNWFLITSLEVDNLEQALQVTHFYTLRWRIEDFHVVFKEGCEVEKLQFGDAPQLKNALVVFSIVAMSVLRLRYLCETQPDSLLECIGIPNEAYFVIAKYLQKVKNINVNLDTQPSILNFVHLICLLSTGNGKNTGMRALWRGYRDFVIIYDTYKAFN